MKTTIPYHKGQMPIEIPDENFVCTLSANHAKTSGTEQETRFSATSVFFSYWTVENFVRRETKKGRTNSAQITRKHQEKRARENSMPHLRFFRIPLASERSGLFALWNFQAGKP